MVNTRTALTVESGPDLSFGAWGDGGLRLFGDGTAATGLDTADDERITARVPEPESHIQLLPLRDLTIVLRRIQPLDRGIAAGVGHRGREALVGVMAACQRSCGECGNETQGQKMAHAGGRFFCKPTN